MSKNNLSYRVDQLEKNYMEMAEKIDEIRTNHLPHIESMIIEVKTRINVMTAINIGAILVAMGIQAIFFKNG